MYLSGVIANPFYFVTQDLLLEWILASRKIASCANYPNGQRSIKVNNKATWKKVDERYSSVFPVNFEWLFTSKNLSIRVVLWAPNPGLLNILDLIFTCVRSYNSESTAWNHIPSLKSSCNHWWFIMSRITKVLGQNNFNTAFSSISTLNKWT